jgi:hypothetical protein
VAVLLLLAGVDDELSKREIGGSKSSVFAIAIGEAEVVVVVVVWW